MILLSHPAQIDQVDSKNKDLGSSYMIKEKVIKILQLIEGVAKFCWVSMSCHKFRFLIEVIVYDKLELICFVSKGLTLSTASLVVIVLFPILLCYCGLVLQCTMGRHGWIGDLRSYCWDSGMLYTKIAG